MQTFNTIDQLKKEAMKAVSPDFHYDLMNTIDDMEDIDLMIFIISEGDPEKEQEWLDKFEANGTEQYEEEIRKQYKELKNESKF